MSVRVSSSLESIRLGGSSGGAISIIGYSIYRISLELHRDLYWARSTPIHLSSYLFSRQTMTSTF